MRAAVATALLVIGVMALPVPPASAGGEPGYTLTIEKAVVGPGPDGPYEIAVQCRLGPASFYEISVGSPYVVSGQLGIDFIYCQVEETDSGGADAVSYECTAVGGAVGTGSGCTSDRTWRFLNWETIEITVTITNTFEEPATTTTSLPPPTAPTSTSVTTTPASTAAAVATAPTFTG